MLDGGVALEVSKLEAVLEVTLSLSSMEPKSIWESENSSKEHNRGWRRCHDEVGHDLTSMIQARKLLPTDGVRHIRPAVLGGLKEIIKTTMILR